MIWCMWKLWKFSGVLLDYYSKWNTQGMVAGGLLNVNVITKKAYMPQEEIKKGEKESNEGWRQRNYDESSLNSYNDMSIYNYN